MSDLPKCENCRFWTRWHRVLLSDDADFSAVMGHCVIERKKPQLGMAVGSIVQGLTGADFHCRAYSSDHTPSTPAQSTPSKEDQ